MDRRGSRVCGSTAALSAQRNRFQGGRDVRSSGHGRRRDAFQILWLRGAVRSSGGTVADALHSSDKQAESTKSRQRKTSSQGQEPSPHSEKKGVVKNADAIRA